MTTTMKIGHGQPGHLNTYTLDEDRYVTGFGRHGRVVCFEPRGDEGYARVDLVRGLREPSDAEILTACRLYGLRGRWRVEKRENWTHGGIDRIDVTLRRAT